MRKRPNQIHRFIKMCFAIFCIALLMTACTPNPKADSGRTYPVIPLLKDFYASLGGEQVLGAAISRKQEEPSGVCQYTVNAKICLNPNVVGDEGFFLAPLGDDLIKADAAASGENANGLVVNGITVFEEFVPIYQQFSGIRFAGNPLTQVRINYPGQRMEQYFENVGFYRNFSDAPGDVHLLAYGAVSCTSQCNYRPSTASALTDAAQRSGEVNLIDQVPGLNGAKDFGVPLTDPYLYPDGSIEQVYSGFVLQKSAEGVIQPRAVTRMLGMLTTEAVEKEYLNESGVVFYALQGSLGYHVPIIFDTFITAHGGVAFSGDPIAEVIEYQPGLFRQCFANYCLDYSPDAPKGAQVSVTPIGNQYLISLQTQPLPAEISASASTCLLQSSVDFVRVAANQIQQVHLLALSATDGSPVTGLESRIALTLPGGKTWVASLPPTDANGGSTMMIPALQNIPNGTILTYQICIKSINPPLCTVGSYLVWTEP